MLVRRTNRVIGKTIARTSGVIDPHGTKLPCPA